MVVLDNIDPREQHVRTLIPIMPGGDHQSLLRLARLLAETSPVLLLGVVPIKDGESLSTGAQPARELRQFIQDQCDRISLRAKPRIRVTYNPWQDIKAVLRREPKIQLLVLDWPSGPDALGLSAADIISSPPTDIALLRGPFPEKPRSVMVPMRGGPHAERALQIGLTLAKPHDADVTAVRIRPSQEKDADSAGFSGMAKVLAEMPEIQHRTVNCADSVDYMLSSAKQTDVVVLGTAAYPKQSQVSFGDIPDAMLNSNDSAVLAIKTKRKVPKETATTEFGTGAISVLVDQWFAENTFHADEFADLQKLAKLKEERGLTVSLALPALNEEATIGPIIETLLTDMVHNAKLLDEIVLIDSNSTDNTRRIARDLGIPVYIHQDILPAHGARPGKGEALWKSLHVTSGDIVLWTDTDISNFTSRFVYGLLGPLLHRTNLMLVKGFYKRPLKTGSRLESGRGGRVTELCARPLFNLFYPELSGIIQPLSGEYGGRREALEQLTFTSGYGVETCVLIETFTKFKLASIAQVDMIERIHNNQTLGNLSKMSFGIIQTLFGRLEQRYGKPLLEDVNRSMKIIKHEPERFYLDVEEIAELERPPMIEIPEYRQARGLDDKPAALTVNAAHDNVIPYSARSN